VREKERELNKVYRKRSSFYAWFYYLFTLFRFSPHVRRV